MAAVSRRRLAFGAAAMGATNVAKIGLQLALLPVMARLLGPAEFGLYSLALPTVTFLLMLADGGLGASLAREDSSAKAVWSSAFWVLQVTSLVLTLGVVAWSFVLAAISGQPRLPPLMSALAVSLILLGLSVLPSARLMQQGRIGVGAVADLIANLVGAAVGVGMAFAGFGAWSLVGQYLTTFGFRTAALNVVSPFLPGRVLKLKPLLPHLAVGGSAVGVRLVDFAGRLVESAAVSRFAGSALLGAYTLANQAPRMICEGASNPLWASLYVQALRGEPEAVAQAHARLTRLLALGLFPLSFITAAAAPQWVHLLLGRGWEATGPLLAIILPTYAVAIVSAQGNAILFAKGRAEVQLALSSGWAAAKVLAVLTVPWLGLTGATAVVGAVNLIYAGAAAWVPAKLTGVSGRRLVGSFAGPLLAAAAAAIACRLLMPAAETRLLAVVGHQAAAFLLYLVLVVALQPRQIAEDIRQARRLLKKA